MKKHLYTALSIILWLIIWFSSARIINNSIFLPGPAAVFCTLINLAADWDFWRSILYSLSHIALGFFTGLLTGILLAVLSSINPFLRTFISIPVKIIRSIPVASFVILSLLWVRSSELSILISSMMTLPIIYTGVMSGIDNTDTKLLEMAHVFRISTYKKIRYIYIPYVLPSLTSVSGTAAGFAWKAGIAAEIIGIVRNSIGNRLYLSKLYLETPELFAWTITIIMASFIFEKAVILLLKIISDFSGGIRNEGGK